MEIKINFKNLDAIETLNYNEVTMSIVGKSKELNEDITLLTVNGDEVNLNSVEELSNVSNYISVLINKIKTDKEKLAKLLQSVDNITSLFDLQKVQNHVNNANKLDDKINVYSLIVEKINALIVKLSNAKCQEGSAPETDTITLVNDTTEEEGTLDIVCEDTNKKDLKKERANYWANEFLEQVENIEVLTEGQKACIEEILTDYGYWLLNK
jgi:hypothetical protein